MAEVFVMYESILGSIKSSTERVRNLRGGLSTRKLWNMGLSAFYTLIWAKLPLSR